MQRNGEELNSHNNVCSQSSENSELIVINILEYTLILGVILSTNSVFWNAIGMTYNYVIRSMVILSVGLLSVWLCVNYRHYRVNLSKQLMLVVVYLLMLVPILANSWIAGELAKSDWIRLLVFAPLSIPYLDWIVRNNGLIRLARKYILLITGLSALSILFWGATQLGILNSNMSLAISWGGQQVIPGLWGVQFFPQGEVGFLGIQLIRNCGIFCEAPMYSFVITVALMIIIFFHKIIHIERWKIVILAITLLSTAATTGVIVIILSLALKLLLDSRMSLKLLIGIIGLPIVFVVLESILTSKVNSMGGSVDIRQEDIIAGYHAWMQRPLLGHGLSDADAYLPFISFYRTVLNGNDGFSSGLMQVLSKTGIYGGVLFVAFPVLLSRVISKQVFGFAVLLFVDFTMTVVDNTYLLLIIVLLFYVGLVKQVSQKYFRPSEWVPENIN